MNIVLLEGLGITQEKLNAYQQKMEQLGHQFTAYDLITDEAGQVNAAKDADILMIANHPLSGNVIRQLKNCKLIDIAFTGYDHVDMKAAKEMGICVCNASGYATQAVAEVAIGMMLSLLRNVDKVQDRCRNGGTKAGLVGRELCGKTVGIVGFGKIGRQTALLCQAFGAKVITSTRSAHKVPEGVENLALEELLRKSDIVSLHCPLTDATRGLISAERLALMKPDALLINTARGGVVDTAALAEALHSGKIAGAGIDVFDTEPPLPLDQPLLHTPNTLVTPHIAFASQEAMEKRAEIVFGNIESFLAGKPENVVSL